MYIFHLPECGVFAFASLLATEFGLTTECARAQPTHKLNSLIEIYIYILRSASVVICSYFAWKGPVKLGEIETNEFEWSAHWSQSIQHRADRQTHHMHMQCDSVSKKEREPRTRHIRDDLLNFDMMCDSKILWIYWNRVIHSLGELVK